MRVKFPRSLLLLVRASVYLNYAITFYMDKVQPTLQVEFNRFSI